MIDTAVGLVLDEPEVLLVSGSDLTRRLMLPGLRDQGFRVTTATDATAALRLRQSGVRFDLMLVDLALADMDPMAFARTVRSGGGWAELPLIAVSLCPDVRRRDSEMAAGFVSHISILSESLLVES